ncbi:MAG: hypothetical protein HQ547_03590, partial [Candidatus Omnitrophica bacterium]|nr:hypothetical protein [Candidatus Omnitrophota bacterium]
GSKEKVIGEGWFYIKKTNWFYPVKRKTAIMDTAFERPLANLSIYDKEYHHRCLGSILFAGILTSALQEKCRFFNIKQPLTELYGYFGFKPKWIGVDLYKKLTASDLDSMQIPLKLAASRRIETEIFAAIHPVFSSPAKIVCNLGTEAKAVVPISVISSSKNQESSSPTNSFTENPYPLIITDRGFRGLLEGNRIVNPEGSDKTVLKWIPDTAKKIEVALEFPFGHTPEDQSCCYIYQIDKNGDSAYFQDSSSPLDHLKIYQNLTGVQERFILGKRRILRSSSSLLKENPLTEKQQILLGLFDWGMTPKEVCQLYGWDTNKLSNVLKYIYPKVSLSGRSTKEAMIAEAIKRAKAKGWIEPFSLTMLKRIASGLHPLSIREILFLQFFLIYALVYDIEEVYRIIEKELKISTLVRKKCAFKIYQNLQIPSGLRQAGKGVPQGMIEAVKVAVKNDYIEYDPFVYEKFAKKYLRPRLSPLLKRILLLYAAGKTTQKIMKDIAPQSTNVIAVCSKKIRDKLGFGKWERGMSMLPVVERALKEEVITKHEVLFTRHELILELKNKPTERTPKELLQMLTQIKQEIWQEHSEFEGDELKTARYIAQVLEIRSLRGYLENDNLTQDGIKDAFIKLFSLDENDYENYVPKQKGGRRRRWKSLGQFKCSLHKAILLNKGVTKSAELLKYFSILKRYKDEWGVGWWTWETAIISTGHEPATGWSKEKFLTLLKLKIVELGISKIILTHDAVSNCLGLYKAFRTYRSDWDFTNWREAAREAIRFSMPKRIRRFLAQSPQASLIQKVLPKDRDDCSITDPKEISRRREVDRIGLWLLEFKIALENYLLNGVKNQNISDVCDRDIWPIMRILANICRTPNGASKALRKRICEFKDVFACLSTKMDIRRGNQRVMRQGLAKAVTWLDETITRLNLPESNFYYRNIPLDLAERRSPRIKELTSLMDNSSHAAQGHKESSSPVESKGAQIVSTAVKVAGTKVPVRVVIKPFDYDSKLGRRWMKKAAGKLLPPRQIGLLEPITYLGVIGNARYPQLSARFIRELILTGILWQENLKKDILVDVSRRNPCPRVYTGKRLKENVVLNERVQFVWQKVREDLHKLREEDKSKEESVKRVEKIAFFQQHFAQLEIAENKYAFSSQKVEAAEAGLRDKFVAVCGEIEQQEAQELTKAFNQHRPDSLRKLGHTIIILKQNQITIESENSKKQAEGDILSFIKGFLTFFFISDIHLGSGSNKEEDLIAIAQLIDKLKAALKANGDFIDLWRKKFGRIKRTHQKLFAAFKPVRRIDYVAGNHDTDILKRIINDRRSGVVLIAKANQLSSNDKRYTHLNKIIAGLEKEGKKFRVDEKFILSSGFKQEGIAKEGWVYYIDKSIFKLYKGREDQRLWQLYNDIQQCLTEEVKRSLGNAQIMEYFLDRSRRIFAEHGHNVDPDNYQTLLGHSNDPYTYRALLARTVVWLIGKLEYVWVNVEYDLNKVKDKVLKKLFPRFFARREVVKPFVRIYCLGEELKKLNNQEWIILYGHTHRAVAVGEGPINALL